MNKKPEIAEETEKNNEPAPKKTHVRRDLIIGIFALVVTVAFGVLAIMYENTIMRYAAGYSLIGVLVISFLAGSLLSFTAIPIPYWALVITLPTALAVRWGLLAPFAVGLVSALGATIGHMPTFMIGYGGRSLSQKVTSRFTNNRWYKRIMGWSHRHGWIAVFLTSALPNPIHLPLTVGFGTLRYPPWKFFVYSLWGNAVKNLFLALAGYYGLTSLLKLFGL